MTVPRTAADVLDDHVTFELECIDRLYLNLYQPKLQHELGVVGFFKGHRGFQFVSSALMDPITKAFVTAIHRYVNDHDIPLVDFRAGERKDDIAQRYLAGHDGAEGILFVGRAQEKTSAFRTEKRRNPQTGATFPWLVRRSAMVNHFYFYGFDADFGPFFIKFATYFPYNAKVCLNGHHYAQQQAAAAGIAFQALDNGFVSADDPARLQRICDDLDPQRIDAFCRKWLKALPHPFSPADRTAGYRYDSSILQAEFSRTQVLDRPLAGRVFFEEVIRDNLDAGRPDRVWLIFARHIIKTTPGRFRTRVLHNGVQPSLYIDSKHAKIKQTTSSTAPFGPRPRSTTRATSGSANGSTTFPHSGRSASWPTVACWRPNASAVTPPEVTTSTVRSAAPQPSATNGSPGCAWMRSGHRCCCPPWSCSACCQAGSPTMTCASSWHPCSGSTPAH